MSKRATTRAQTKQNIMDAFWTLYCEKRLEKITVKEVASKAGYNRGTFYEYFTDVYDVLRCIEDSLIPTLDDLPPLAIPTGTLGMPLMRFYEFYEQNSMYYSVLLGEKGDPSFASRLKDSIKPMMLQSFADKPNIDKRELEYILEYTLSAMIGVMSYHFRQKDAFASDRLHQLINRLMEQGVVKQLPF